jgi:excisionase family DNA binding protein
MSAAKKLFVDDPVDPKLSRHYDILMKFKEGEFPNLDKYTMIEVGTAIADFEFIDFLKSERDKLQGTTTKTVAKVPVELKVADATGEHHIIAQIPTSFFEQLGRGQTAESQETAYASDKKAFPEPKLYTREQAAEVMQVSKGTIDNLTKDGTLKCHLIQGTKLKRYKWEDIDNALHAIEMRLNKRFH